MATTNDDILLSDDEEEYETDSDVEEGSSSSDDDDESNSDSEDDDEEEEEEQWSLRVRLLSAVDLPPSLSPNVPLCPMFKFGLVDDVNVALDKIEEEKQKLQLQQQKEQMENDLDKSERELKAALEEKDGIMTMKKEIGQRKKRILHPKREGDDEDDSEEESSAEEYEVPIQPPQQHQSSKKQQQQRQTSSSANNMNTTSRLLSTLSNAQTRSSSHKIMSRNINGGGGNGADWNEEYRWNELKSPMESCLLVKLNTRLAPDNTNIASGGGVGGGGMGSGGGGISAAMSGEDTFSESGSGYDAEETGFGLRGLWRKGREQLEEVHRRRTSAVGGDGANPREERAAAVAQFLMRGGGHGSCDNNDGGLNQEDLVEYQQKWNEAKKQNPQGGDNDGIMDFDSNTGAVRTMKSKDENDINNNNTAEGLCLGTLTIPLSRLPLEDVFIGNKNAVVEQWYQLDDPNVKKKKRELEGEEDGGSSMGGLDDDDDEEPTLLHGPRRCPSVLLEITFASSDYLDESEEHLDKTATTEQQLPVELSALNLGIDVPSTPVPQQNNEPKQAQQPKEEKKKPQKKEEPELEPGIIDFVCIVGARDIGNQRNDDGSKGWVQSTPECCVLERYPPTDEFHVNNGRMTGLIPQIEWFCFPEGCKLWRGTDSPTWMDMRAGGVSMISTTSSGRSNRGGHPLVGGIDGNEYHPTKFDRALGTTSSFSWFVLSSNSDVYGSRIVKTYGTMVRFYVPAPVGIDPTQDDFAQTMNLGGGASSNKRTEKDVKNKKRLWVPIGICISTTLPIVGIVEEILLRTCNAMASKLSSDDASATELLTNPSSANSSLSSSATSKLYSMLQTDLYHLIVNFSKPMEGVVHSSIPFLEGERLHVTVSPPNGLPPLPHGGAVAATCRLLGAEGLTLLLAAALTECRILIHSTNVAHVAMVAEVITALIFPFQWQLPYIPVLAQQMLEMLDAPMPFFVGLPTASLQNVEKRTLSEIVVVDLDDIASFTEHGRGPRNKVPPALPASVSTSISKAVYRLLKEEDELEKEMEKNFFPGMRRSPSLESESLPERMFRIHVALQICSLVRGYQECLFFVSALQPVFNRDRFLRQAPALFEDKRPSVLM